MRRDADDTEPRGEGSGTEIIKPSCDNLPFKAQRSYETSSPGPDDWNICYFDLCLALRQVEASICCITALRTHDCPLRAGRRILKASGLCFYRVRRQTKLAALLYCFDEGDIRPLAILAPHIRYVQFEVREQSSAQRLPI